jgi:hypothetical protein
MATNTCTNCKRINVLKPKLGAPPFSVEKAKTKTKDCPDCQWVLSVLVPAAEACMKMKTAEDVYDVLYPIMESAEYRRVMPSAEKGGILREVLDKFGEEIIEVHRKRLCNA